MNKSIYDKALIAYYKNEFESIKTLYKESGYDYKLLPNYKDLIKEVPFYKFPDRFFEDGEYLYYHSDDRFLHNIFMSAAIKYLEQAGDYLYNTKKASSE